MKRRSLLSILLLLFYLTAGGQDKKAIDSIEMKLPTLRGLEKARALYELVYYYLRVDNQKAREYLLEARIIRDIQDPSVAAYTHMSQGIYYNRNGMLDSAVYFLEEAKKSAIKGNETHALVRIYSALAHTFISSGKPEKGLDYLFQGLRVINDHPDKEMEMKLRTNIPWAYLELKQYHNCIEYGLQNLPLMEGSDYEWIALYTYNNLAVSYGALKILDSAKYFIEKGISAAKKNSDNQSLANAYFILGTIYSNAGEYTLAIEQYLKARPFREKVGNPLFLVSDLYAVSDLYYKSGDYQKGVKAGNEALQLAEKFHLLLKFEGTYLSLAKNYEGLNDYKNAGKFYRLYAMTKDTIYKNASTDAIAEMQTRYETEKKEKRLAVQKSELLEQRAEIQQTYVIIGGLVLTLILLMSIFILLRARLKRKQEILQKEGQLFLREAQIQASIQSQESERKRFAQDLHDGMGQLISALRLALHGVDKETSMEQRLKVVTKGENILNEMHHEIRSIAFNLMPQTLVQHGLVPALKEMSDRLNGSEKIMVRVSSFDMPQRLSELEEISLYRVVQEWINNIIKYAKASVIQIQLIGHESEINVTIEDDGSGFDEQILHNSTGNGWKNICSRLNLVKGSIEVDSRVGFNGTTVIIRIPLIAGVKDLSKQEPSQWKETRSETVAPNTL